MYQEKTQNAKPREAAVLLAIAGNTLEAQRILLTRRSKAMRTHSGEVALPGGMRDPDDQTLRDTAAREANEEVGLQSHDIHWQEQMPPRFTRQGTQVTPCIARVPNELNLQPCPQELESLFWLPLPWLLADKRVRTDIFTVNHREFWAPVYQFEDYTIWGFTARLLVDFANRCYGSDIVREHSAEERLFVSG